VPGLAGVLGHGDPAVLGTALVAMLGALHREPFHASGLLHAPTLGVHAAWTAHRGSFAERACLHREPDGARLLFAGECRPDGEAKPTADGGTTDPAAVLARYRARGPGFVDGLNGLHCGLVVDPVRGRAVLFNDRYGSERLYVHERDGLVWFASEAKALLRVLPALRAFDEFGVAQFLRYGSTRDGRTLFRDVRLLPGGSAWVVEASGRLARTRWFRPEDWETLPVATPKAFAEDLAETLRRRAPLQAGAEGGAVGISITGGLDTRMIMACLRTGTRRPVCYTYAGAVGETLDVRIGRRVAAECGLEHHTLRLAPDFLARYGEHVDTAVEISDGCAGATGAHELPLSRLARELAPVRLTGNYGSEVLRGVSTLKPRSLPAGFVAPDFEARLAEATPEERRVHPVTAAAFREIPWHLYGTLAAARSQLTCRTPYLDDELVRLAYRAPPESRLSAGPSLQVVRALAPALAAIPTDGGLRAGDGALRARLRRGAAVLTAKLDYVDSDELPRRLRAIAPLLPLLRRTSLLGRHRFLSYRRWFQVELAGHVEAVANDPRVRRLGFWRGDAPAAVAAAHRRGECDGVHALHVVLTLEAIDRLLLAPPVRACDAECA
jgi:asparagine synthase (glutamine-hydrolysing)